MSEPKIFNAAWPKGLKQETIYEVSCDDGGREGGSWLRVFIGVDGDAHVMMQEWENIKSDPDSRPDQIPHIRVRTYAGGGRNHRTRQALVWLADAIRRDNEENGKAG